MEESDNESCAPDPDGRYPSLELLLVVVVCLPKPDGLAASRARGEPSSDFTEDLRDAVTHASGDKAILKPRTNNVWFLRS